MVAAICTCPLDVVKTRLQSSYYQRSNTVTSRTRPSQSRSILLGEIWRREGVGALFKGLGPNLVGVVPARAIHFWTYGNGKRIFSELNNGKETPIVHLISAVTAGIVTSTLTNPIWMVKTRMQLQQSGRDQNLHHMMSRKYKNSLDCLIQIVRDEGIKGLYKGMSASYLGAIESTIQWVIYEYGKKKLAERKQRSQEKVLPVSHSHSIVVGGKDTGDWLGHIGTAAIAKFVAACISYPHEVLRTRLRQPAENGVHKYTGLLQCLQIVWREEGVRALYGGMTTHLIRVVPNAAIMFFCYEAILHRYGGVSMPVKEDS